jgi:hypothetical protein
MYPSTPACCYKPEGEDISNPQREKLRILYRLFVEVEKQCVFFDISTGI